MNKPGNSFNVKLPTNPNTVATVERAIAVFRPRLAVDFQHEIEMYAVVCDMIRAGLNHNASLATVYDTSRRQYLELFLPDLTIALPGTIEPDSLSVYVVVDMKFRAKKKNKESKKLGTRDDFGQLYDYLIAVQNAQPGRCTCVALLSDIERNYVVTLGSAGNKERIVQHAADTMAAALAYIHDTVLGSATHGPPQSGFSESAGILRRRLGNPHHSIVGEFLVPGTTTEELMAVKRTTTKTREKYFLQMFKDNPTRPGCIPLLVFDNDDEIEYGITPVGTPLQVGSAASAFQMRTILSDIITATNWLHGLRIVHRDIRCDNIVLIGSRAVLIDFDCSYYLNCSLPTTYRGGKLCVPPTYLANSAVAGLNYRYVPSFADDCFAVLLLVYCLLFPARFADLRTVMIGIPGTPDSAALLQFWNDLQVSPLWMEYITIAKRGKVNDLLVMLDIFH